SALMFWADCGPVSAAECVPVPSGIVAWWRLEGDGADFLGLNNGILVGTPVFSSGQVGQAMTFDGVNDEMDIPASSSLNVGTNNGFTIESWINPSQTIAGMPI